MSVDGPLFAAPLEWDHCVSLAPRLSAGDTFECLAMGHLPEQALAAGLFMGPATAVLRKDTGTPVGAFGYTAQGSIWSLWSTLSRVEAFQVLRETPGWVEDMVVASGLPTLSNFAACANTTALAWLRQSRCFWIADQSVEKLGQDYVYFETLLPPRSESMPACATL